MAQPSAILREIRSEVCNTALGWLCIIGTMGVGLSLVRIFEFGWLPVMTLHVAVLAVAVLIYGLRARLPFFLRAGTIIVIMFLVALGGHISFGPPTRLEFFVAAIIMSAVFFGERAGVVSGIIAGLLIGAVYIAIAFEVLAPPHIEGYSTSATATLTHVGSVIVAAFAPLIAVTRYREYLERERQRADSASRAKSEFLAMMSHELRTPMTAIIGMTDLIKWEKSLETARSYSAQAAKSAKSLLRLLNEILDFSKIEANRLTIEADAFSLNEMLADLTNLFAPLAAEKGLTFDVRPDERIPDSLHGDAGRIRQVLVNLVGNAIKFTERGDVIVEISYARLSDTRLTLAFRVSDTGIGISEAEQAQLFQPFIQVGPVSTRRYGGSGLGLVISKRLAELMGGTLEVSSQRDKGAAFNFTVPVWIGAAAASQAAPPAEELAPSGLRILIAEDDIAIGFLLRTVLTRWGNTVTVTLNGLDVVSAAKSAEYDVILMDQHLPGRDGANATREIRNLGGPAGRTPVIALTADISPGSRRDLAASGISSLVAKPINWNALAREIINTCNCVTFAPLQETFGHAGDEPGHVAAVDVVAFQKLRTDLGETFFLSLLEKLVPTIEQYAGNLQKAVREGQAHDAREAAHAIKGAALQFGAGQIGELAGEIERAASFAEMTPIAERLLECIPHLQQALKELA
jgi:signal transduction histidine kinase/HPt (histidine-containing phosphotransfer) domain-containing protein